MTFQTSYSTDNAVGRAGMLADLSEPHSRDTGVASAALGVGLAVIKHATSRVVSPIADVTLDVDSILASGGASAATAQVITTASFNGAIGTGRIVPAQQVTLTLNSHADWDLTTMTVYGEDADGSTIAEEVLIPNGGNATISTKAAFGRVTGLAIPAQTGTNGTYTVGTAPTNAEYSRADLRGVAEWQGAHMPYDTTTFTGGQYDANEDLPVITRGRVWVITEDAVAKGDRVYVRIVTASTDLPGQFGGDRSASFALVRGAHFVTAQASADGLAVIQL